MTMGSLRFWLRWSWRDWRARWVQIAVISLTIALGSGGYAGMLSMMEWRQQSHESAAATLNMYDLRVRLTTGSFVSQGSLAAALATVPHPEHIDVAEERLLSNVQARFTSADETLLAFSPIVGVDVSADGPHVNRVYVAAGRGLSDDDAGRDTVLISRAFAIANDLPESGELTIAGGRTLRYVGHGLSPEYLTSFASAEYGGFLTPATYAPLFMPLETAQAITAHPGQVNDIVISLAPGADRESVAAEIETALERELPDVGAVLMRTEDDPARQAIFDDIENDRQLMTIFAVLIFVGAVGASFSLTSRFIETQRREFGIAMSLGIPRRRIAVRPLLVGAEIALLGVIFGVLVGIMLGRQLQPFLRDLQPLPEWNFDFQYTIFAQGAVIGFLLPFLATAIPVIRAVRVSPIQAMQIGYRASRGGGLATHASWLRIPGSIFAQIPFRNLLRAPRRSILTVLGVAAAMAMVVSLIGFIDTFSDAIDRSDTATIGDTPERLILNLNGFHAIQSDEIAAIATASSVGDIEPGLRLGATLVAQDQEIDVALEFIDFGNDIWRPALNAGDLVSQTPGILISQKAADDLGIGVGDALTLRHPQRVGPTSFVMTDSPLPVQGVHTSPLRPLAYVDIQYADLAGLAGVTNLIDVVPAPGASTDQLKDEMFALDVIAFAQPVSEISKALREFIASFADILQTFQAIPLLLALLIAFNAAGINLDERARDYATMFAYGIPVRTVLRMTIIESLLIGVVGTLLGILGGFLIIRWILGVTAASTLEDVGLNVVVYPRTVAISFALGVIAVALAPLLTVRRLRRMDIPSTLRVME